MVEPTKIWLIQPDIFLSAGVKYRVKLDSSCFLHTVIQGRSPLVVLLFALSTVLTVHSYDFQSRESIRKLSYLLVLMVPSRCPRYPNTKDIRYRAITNDNISVPSVLKFYIPCAIQYNVPQYSIFRLSTIICEICYM